ncbi:unnamed protein product [Peronospora effusa]|nr:unnamed protein product [Peronospora effusa]
MSYAFDCILAMPWLARYNPQIDCLARSVRRRRKAIDGPLCTACAVLRDTSDSDYSLQSEEDDEDEAVEQGFPHQNAVGLPHGFTAAEQELPHQVSTLEFEVLPSSVFGILDEDIQCLEGGDGLPPECGSPASSSDSKHDGDNSTDNLALECVHAIVYVEGSPQIRQYIEVESPPRHASSITSLPGLSWKHSLRDLKGGTVEQVCLITNEVVTVANEEHMARP